MFINVECSLRHCLGLDADPKRFSSVLLSFTRIKSSLIHVALKVCTTMTHISLSISSAICVHSI